jgi:PST family polysaccharide transporter
VGVATRFAEILSFARTATWRLSMSALARLNGDRRRALTAITEGMRLQVLLLGPLLAGFAFAAPYVMPLVFRDRWPEWSRSMDVYPYIALGILCNAVFSMHSSMLFVLRRNGLVAAFHAVHIAILFGAAAYFLPRYGVVGAGYAEIAAILSYPLIHMFISRVIGPPHYLVAATWAVAMGLLLFTHQLGWIASVGLIAAALWPTTWRTLDGYARMILPTRTVSPA